MRRVLYVCISIFSLAMIFFVTTPNLVHAAALPHFFSGYSNSVPPKVTGGGCGPTLSNNYNGASASYYSCMGTNIGSIEGRFTVSFSAPQGPSFTYCQVFMAVIDDTTQSTVGGQIFNCLSQAKQGLKRQLFTIDVGNYNGNHLFYTTNYVNYIYTGHLSYGPLAYSYDMCPYC